VQNPARVWRPSNGRQVGPVAGRVEAGSPLTPGRQEVIAGFQSLSGGPVSEQGDYSPERITSR
jgi:hypothetical protein